MVFHRASDVGRDAQYRAPDLRSEAVILPSRKFVRDFEYFSSNIHGFACQMGISLKLSLPLLYLYLVQ